MLHILSIALGGALGALGRYGLTLLSHSITGFSGLGTFVANIVGSFLMGMGWMLLHHINVSTTTKLFLMTGCLGAFTTFSTFNLEILQLVSAGKIKLGISYLLMSIVGGLSAVALGALIAKSFLR
ncbi:MAG: fluoride efflux transporter CrcB [Candidatus Margulisbacteria bacterium]|nr:fluoride efflux transporter CrcB [Candidatus Margulisiibacteriota bacterium]